MTPPINSVSDEARRIIDTYGRETPADDLALVLFETWCKADPSSGPNNYPASYIATFADMARAALEWAARRATNTPVGDGMTDEQIQNGEFYAAAFRPFASPALPSQVVGVTDEMVEAACKSTDPLLFSGDPQTEHMAASPYKVEHVQNLVRAKMRAALTAALTLPERGM